MSDTTPPTVTITSTESSPTGVNPIPITITFSESVTGFTVDDITASSGSLNTFAGSGAVYTVNWVPGARSLTMDIAAGVCVDGAGNGNTAADQFSIIWEYAEKVKALFTTNILSYLPLWESSGLVADDYYTTNRDGAYSASNTTLGETGIGDGRTCVLIAAEGGFVNWYSAGLSTAFNGKEGTLAFWAKVPGAFWTDGVSHTFARMYGDANNNFVILKTAVNGRIEFDYTANGTQAQYRREDSNETTWLAIALTWSDTNDRVRVYVNGTKISTDISIATWGATSLNSIAAALGAQRTDSPTYLSLAGGWLAHAVLLNREATAPEVAAFSTLPF